MAAPLLAAQYRQFDSASMMNALHCIQPGHATRNRELDLFVVVRVLRFYSNSNFELRIFELRSELCQIIMFAGHQTLSHKSRAAKRKHDQGIRLFFATSSLILASLFAFDYHYHYHCDVLFYSNQASRARRMANLITN